MAKFVNAIIKIPLEIVNGEISASHSDCASFSFEWIDKIPQKRNFTQSEIIKQLYAFLSELPKQPSIEESLNISNPPASTNEPIQTPTQEEFTTPFHIDSALNASNDVNNTMYNEAEDDASFSELELEIQNDKESDDDSTISYIEESDDDDSIGQNTNHQIEDVTEEPVKMDSFMDIMSIFIKREDLTTRKKPKNSSFKKRSKRKSHRAYTAKNYDETEEHLQVDQHL
jgi:hypothetical protein